jgi:hypothetical protein
MPKSIKAAKEAAGVQDRLRGEKLKDKLVDEQIPFYVCEVQLTEGEYGTQWKVGLDYVTPQPDAIDTLYFSCHADRDDTMSAMGDATLQDSYGPLILTRKGKQGFQVLEDYTGKGE